MSGASAPANTKEPRRRSWIRLSLIGVAIAAAVFAAVVFLRRNGAPTATTATDALNYAEVVITDLKHEEEFHGKLESIKGTGTLIPYTQIDLAFATPGTVADLLVHMGQEVQTGDVLARVDATTLTAQDAIGVAQAQISLDVAQQALDALLNLEPDEDEISQLEASVAAAKAAYNAARGQEAAAGANVAVSNISLAQAERQLAGAQTAYQQAWDPARDWELYAYGDWLNNE